MTYPIPDKMLNPYITLDKMEYLNPPLKTFKTESYLDYITEKSPNKFEKIMLDYKTKYQESLTDKIERLKLDYRAILEPINYDGEALLEKSPNKFEKIMLDYKTKYQESLTDKIERLKLDYKAKLHEPIKYEGEALLKKLPEPIESPLPASRESTVVSAAVQDTQLMTAGLSFASKMMTVVTTWRNLDSKPSEKSVLFWEEKRAVPLTAYLKAAAVELCLPLITGVALVESVVYKTLSILGALFGRENEYGELYQSSSFSIIWSLSDFALFNLIHTNLQTDEIKARKCINEFVQQIFKYCKA